MSILFNPGLHVLIAAATRFLVVDCSVGRTTLRTFRSQRAPPETDDASGKGGERFSETQSRIVVPLRRVDGVGASDIGFFVGDIRVGGQEFSVLFDTASGNIFLPSTQCSNTTCLERRQYEERPAVPINVDGSLAGGAERDAVHIWFSQIDFGDGEVEGIAVRDRVCLGMVGRVESCPQVGVVAATTITELPFRSLPYDGMVGLGLRGLAVGEGFHFLQSLLASTPGLLPQFSIAIRGRGAELTFGGASPAATPPKWFPVLNQLDGFWQVKLLRIRVDNRTVDACAGPIGCRGIVDTGASRLGVPSALAANLGALLGAAPSPTGGCSGPELHLDLPGGFALTLRPEDYSGPTCGGTSRIAPLQLGAEFQGVYVLGETILRRYDTYFDWEAKRVGFSLSMPRAVRLGPPVPDAENDRDLPGYNEFGFIKVLQI